MAVPFIIPTRLPLFDSMIADDATTVVCVRAEAAHEAHLNDYPRYEAAERGATKFLRESVGEVWFNDLKDANTCWGLYSYGWYRCDRHCIGGCD